MPGYGIGGRLNCAAIASLTVTSVITVAAAPPQIEPIFAPLATEKTPGLAVFVRKDGRTIAQRGYGVRDLRTFALIDAKTDFRLASFTKQFTAMAVMLLVHDGKLRYDERLTQIFPEFPKYGEAITVRNLLTHTSGLPDYEDVMTGGPWSESRQIQDGEVLELLERQSSPKFAAGTSWSYSNSAYVVLGLIVAKASGVPFSDFLRQRIFQPLHMDNTLVFVNGRNRVPDRAFGHAREADRFVETDQSSTSATQGDGGIYSNLEDLAKWDQALESHALLGAAEMQAALTPVRLADGSQTRWPAAPGDDNLNPGKPVAYGFGWFLDPYNGRPRMWHSGSTRGFSTVIERFTAEKLTIIVLCNRTDLNASRLALQVADVIR
jgi:CubicO group peptidase (beta-lactamase class C family)